MGETKRLNNLFKKLAERYFKNLLYTESLTQFWQYQTFLSLSIIDKTCFTKTMLLTLLGIVVVVDMQTKVLQHFEGN